MKVAWDLLGDSFCTVLVPSLQLFGLRALLHSLGRTEMLLSPNTLWFPGDGILFVLGVQLCRDLLPAPHFKHFSWAELTIMLVLSNVEVVRYEKWKKGVGQRARVGGGPHWAGLDLGVQVSLHLSGLSKSYHLISRPDHWANAAMFSWGGVTYTITPQLVIWFLQRNVNCFAFMLSGT